MTTGEAIGAAGEAATARGLSTVLAATLPVTEVAHQLASDVEVGLSEGAAGSRLFDHGPNVIRHGTPPTALASVARQFRSTMIALLLVAAVITLLIGDRADTIVIAAIVVLNAVIGFVQEHRAETAMAALDALTTDTTGVVRAGVHAAVDIATLVPGDLVVVAAGDVVPADLRLVVAESLRVDEAALTGESEPVHKDAAPVSDAASILDRRNIAHRGTAVLDGRGVGLVVATGMDTELGRIATLLDQDRRPTPLQRRLAALGHQLAAAAVLVCLTVFLVGVARGEPTEEMLLVAVTLAVAAVPEGLPAVVTVALALGSRRMAARRALVRRLPAVETLGSVSVICTDKTGTLTQNRMAVERVWTPTGTFRVLGAGYSPHGEIVGPDTREALARVAAVARSCNDAVLRPGPEVGAWEISGDPTEGALLALAGRIEHHLGTSAGDDPARIAEMPFDPTRRRMSTVHAMPGGGTWVATKGALGAVVPCLADPAGATEAQAAAEALSDAGFRVLALADRRLLDPPGPGADVEADLELVGIVGISDPPRPGVADAIAACRAAGVETVMITGDHPATATAIADRLGLGTSGADEVMTGAELEALTDGALADRVRDIRVFARTSPEQKLRIVEAWRAHDAVVAMTGDGINDAPALQRADIGVAMGRTGTDVSREAADMVLADDDFSTIVAAVGEGRRIYDNIRRFVRYLLTTNSGEVLAMLLAVGLGLPVPLTPTQILWINLITDGLPAVALGLEPAEDDVMQRPPRPRRQSILGDGLWPRALVFGLVMGVLVLVLQAVARAADRPWLTMGFTALALMQLGNALASRSDRTSVLRRGLRGNPWLVVAVASGAAAQMVVLYVPALAQVFDAEPLGPVELLATVVAAGLVLVAVEVDKAIRHRR